VGLLEDFTTQAALPLRLLAAGAIVLLAIVFINTANLILLRASLRRHAVAIRSVLGAGRRRIARPAIMEGAMLSAAGMGFGLLMASFVIGLIRTAPPPGMPRVDNLAIDGSVIGFAAVCASIATIAFGIIPGAMIARRSLEGVLRARTGGARPMRHVGAFVVAEVALSVALLVSAGLLVRTTARMADVDPGFEPERVLTFRVSLPNVDMSVEQVAGVARELEERVEALPGALSAGLVHALPLSGTLATGPYALTVGELGEADTGPQINYRYASPGYLPTIRARLIAGRHLDGRDPQSSVVIDTELAQTLWRGASAIGRQFAADPMQRGAELFTVVGVVESMHHESIREPGTATAYFSARYYTPPYLWATVRTDGNPAGLVQPIQRTLPEIHADLAMARVGTMNDLLRDATADTRWVMWTMTVFGIAAAVLSAIGLYGTLGHLVSGRMREIGIRLALGARRAQVMALVMRSALLLVGLGLLAGIVASLWISGSLESLLFGISPVDPLSYLAGTAALGLLTGVAAWIPAVRATRVSPTETLHEE
jgi:predicted permease